MANPLLPPEERNLTPDQVEALDKRRDLGHTLLVIAGQFTVIATVLLLLGGTGSYLLAGLGAPHRLLFCLCAWSDCDLRRGWHSAAPGHASHRLKIACGIEEQRGTRPRDSSSCGIKCQSVPIGASTCKAGGNCASGWFVFVFDCEAWVFFLKAPSEAELR